MEVVDLDRVAGWRVSRRVDSAEALHARRPVEGREVVLCRVTRAAVVLGSTEPLSDLDLAACAAEGLEVARRPSGGASVLVVPGEQAWIEVRVPRGDPWWQEDVGRAFHRIGEVWRDALSELGVEGEVHRGPLRSSRWSSRACFCGVGPGEVLVGRAKAVGLAQRRDRSGASFHGAAPLVSNAGRLAAVHDLPPADRRRLTVALTESTYPLASDVERLEEAFLAALAARSGSAGISLEAESAQSR